MRKLFWLLIVFLMISPCFAQTDQAEKSCSLSLQEAPAVFGFRLGMTQQEIQNIIGRSLKFKPKKNGTRSFFHNFIKKSPPPLLQGVRALYLRFFENRLYQIEIFYEERNDWQTLEDFRLAFSASHRIADSLWENVKGKTELKCPGFTLAADKILNPRIEITDPVTLAQFEEFQLREKEKAQR